MTPRARRLLSRSVVYVLAWTAVGLFQFSRDLSRRLYWDDPMPWRELFASWMIGIYITGALAAVVLWLGARWPIERSVWVRRAALHLAGSVVFSVLQLAIEAAVTAHLRLLSTPGTQSFLSFFPTLLVIGFHGNVVIYWMILGIQSLLRYYRRSEEREQAALRLGLHASELKTQLVRAQLSALKMQLQPHFLFNTLNAVVVLVRQGKGHQAEEMLARLSDLLRWVLDDDESQEVPLRRELEHLQLYLAIEQVRFPDRLQVDVTADAIALDAAVPHMGLQPLVENAIRHGVERHAGAGRIHIRAARVDGTDTLEITVEDDGPGFVTSVENGNEVGGIGLANTRARLAQLYGEAAALTTSNGTHGGAVVTMRLPYRLADDSPEKEPAHATHDLDRR
jgi:two-component system, LytTR family, sensor kinase